MIFELSGYWGREELYRLPSGALDDDAVIADARAALHKMVSALGADSQNGRWYGIGSKERFE